MLFERHFVLGLGLVVLATRPTVIDAFGGLFARDTNDNGPTVAVELTKSSSILGLKTVDDDEEAKKEATLHVQIEYQTTPPPPPPLADADAEATFFGWILPLPARPIRVHLGSALLFHSLSKPTQETWDLEWLDTTVAGALPTDHFSFNTNLSYCTQDMLKSQCQRKPDDVMETLFGLEDDPTMEGETEDHDAASTPPLKGGVDVADYFDYEILETAEDVLAWLELHDYVLPHLQSNHTDENDWWLEEAQWQSMLEEYVQQDGAVFMVLQLEHQPYTTKGTSQPIMIQYEINHNDNGIPVHRLPLEMSALTAAPDAIFDSYWMSPEVSERAVPLNYLDLQLDDDLIDWMSCREAENPTQCFQADLVQRLHQASLQVHPHSLLTEYAGPLEDVYTPLSCPEGLTVILAASTSWLGFLSKLRSNGIPPIPLVLEIIDQYVPPPSSYAAAPQWARVGGGDEEQSWTVEACLKLNHLYEAPHERSMLDDPNTPVPTLKECFDMYQPPTEDWVFNAQALASDLDNRVFQPYRNAQQWMRSAGTPLQSLTRLFGLLDAAHASADPYVALMKTANQPPTHPKHHTAKAAAVCDDGLPMAIEFTTSASRVWQPVQYGCESWEAQGNNLILDLQEGIPTNRSEAVMVTGWGGQQLARSEETGQFDLEQVDRVIKVGEMLLRDILDGKAVIETVNEKDDQKEEDNQVTTNGNGQYYESYYNGGGNDNRPSSSTSSDQANSGPDMDEGFGLLQQVESSNAATTWCGWSSLVALLLALLMAQATI